MKFSDKINKKEGFIILTILLTCVLALVLFYTLSPKGTVAVISMENQTAALHGIDGNVVAKTSTTQPNMEIDLSTDGIFVLQNTRLPVTFEVKDNSVRIINSVCPDQICETYGWLSLSGQFATCLPAGVNITIAQ